MQSGNDPDQGPSKTAGEVVKLFVVEGGRGRGGGGGAAGGDDDDGERVFGSDDHLATELVKVEGDDWRCAAGHWHFWDGKRWLRDQTKMLWELTRRICRRTAKLIDDKKMKRQLTARSTIYAAAGLAEGDRKVAMNIADFDPDPWLLNTPLGILDLHSGQLGPHRRDALMTRIAGAGPGGECPTFKRYLDEVTGGDVELQKYLQRVAGYCLTGSIEEHCILFFHGPGGSGKSTFLLLIQDLLGDYAVNSPMNAFTVAVGERHPTELAHFAGARVVTASEIEEGMRWDEGKLKAISGGDKITARFMRGDFFTFEPQFKLLLAGNHRPRMRSADDAMRRRMQVIPFRHKPKIVDKNLREKLRAELGAILVWAMEGEAERQRLGGLRPPQVVIEATERYFRDENTLGRWLDERCEIGPQYWTETNALYASFCDWARRVGEYPITLRVFRQKLEGMDFRDERHPKTRRHGWRGVWLLSETPDLPFDNGVAAPVRQPGELSLSDPLDDDGDDYPRE